MTTVEVDRRGAIFAEQRAYLFAVAYRLLGIAEDADDALQDAWLRFADVDLEEIDTPRAYLVTIVTRLCLDVLRSARRRREQYAGIWLPEPVTSSEALPEELAERADSVSFAFLLLMERLNPVERAVLVLHDVFDYSHEEVGAVIGRSAAASRQALRRGRKRLGDVTRTTRRPSDHDRELIGRFLEATDTGNLDQLEGALARSVTLISDGGGTVNAANRPIAGKGLVGRFLVAMSPLATPDGRAGLTELNGQPAVVTYEAGILTNAFVFDTSNDGVTAIYVVRNPEKLRRLEATLS